MTRPGTGPRARSGCGSPATVPGHARRLPSRSGAGPVRLLTVGLVALVALAALVVPATSAEAQPDDPVLRLEITDLGVQLGPGSIPEVDDDPLAGDAPLPPRDLTGRVLIEHLGEVPLDGLRFVVEVYPETRTRGLLREALRERPAGTPIAVSGMDLRDGGAVRPGELVGAAIDISATDIPWADGAGGVHPVRLTVLRGTTVLVEVTTAVTWLNQRPAEPVDLSVIWPFDGPPWRGPGGAYAPAAAREIEPGERFDVLLGVLERMPTEALTLAPAPHLLEDLVDRSGGFVTTQERTDGSSEALEVGSDSVEATRAARMLRRLRTVSATGIPAVTGTYADADLGALLAAGGRTAQLASLAAADGRDRLTTLLAGPVDTRIHLHAGPLTPGMLDVIPAETIVASADAVGLPALGSDPALGSPVRPAQAPSGRRVTVIIPDPYLAEVLADPVAGGGPLVTAQHLAAHTAMFYLEAPARAGRALVVAPPSRWAPTPVLAEGLLQQLHDATWLDPVRLGDVPLRTVRDAVDLDLPTTVFPSGPSPEVLAEVADRWDAVTALRAALPDPEARIAAREVDDLEDDLVRATSRWVGNQRRDAMIRAVAQTVTDRIGDLEITTGTVTLTSDTGQIPVTVQRNAGGPIDVVVSVESQGRVLWPEGRRSEILTLDDGGSQTVSFTARALSTGTFPVTVRVSDPAGIQVVTETTVSVRSTAISGPALIGTGALVAILLLIGAGRGRTRSTPDDGEQRPPRLRVAAQQDER